MTTLVASRHSTSRSLLSELLSLPNSTQNHKKNILKSARILTSTESLELLWAKGKKKKEEQEEREQKKADREKKTERKRKAKEGTREDEKKTRKGKQEG